MDSVFHRPPPDLPIDEIKCRYAHTIDGAVPDLGVFANAERYDGKICDCGMINYFKEWCGCPGDPYRISTRENPSHGR